MSKSPVRWRLCALIGLALSLPTPGVLSAQICSCGGAPLLSSLEFGGIPERRLRATLAYKYHNISDVVSGSQQLVNDTRWQVSQSGLFKVTYGLLPTLSLSAVITLVQKERAAGDHLLVRGIGDGMLIANISLLQPNAFGREELRVSAGVKGPVGRSTLSLDGTLLPIDLQPTSGAWDGIVSAYFSRGLVRGRPLNLHLSAAYRWTGTAQRFGSGDLGYKVGDRLVASLGGGYAWGPRLSASLTGLIILSSADKIGNFNIATTGGTWVNMIAGANFQLSDAINLGLTGQLPVYRNLRGAIQLTTSYSLGAALHYELNVP